MHGEPCLAELLAARRGVNLAQIYIPLGDGTCGYDLAGAKNPTSNGTQILRQEKRWRGMSERFGRRAGAYLGASKGHVVLFLALLAFATCGSCFAGR